MELNADFSRRVAVLAARLRWVASPIAGVDKRMLDRIGDELARATSIRVHPARGLSRRPASGEAKRLLSARRPGASGVPVAGISAVQ